MDEFIEKDQHIHFSGTCAAHQNGVAKRGIQTVIQIARTMTIHSTTYSPHGTITAELWPMAIYQLVWLYNQIPREDSGISTYELWSLSSFLPIK